MAGKQTEKVARRDTLETRKQMIDAAEALFAEHGVDNVTLLDIARAAGQKNRNAPQYHFGDKAGLINAVLDKHSNLISAHRREMLDELAGKDSPTMAELAAAYVLPVTRHCDETANSLAYLLINAGMMTSSVYTELRNRRADALPEVLELMKLMGAAMPAVSPRQREARLLLIQSMLFHGLASFYSANPAASTEVFAGTLCAGVEAVLMEPA